MQHWPNKAHSQIEHKAQINNCREQRVSATNAVKAHLASGRSGQRATAPRSFLAGKHPADEVAAVWPD